MKFKFMTDRPELPRLIVSGMHKGTYEVCIEGEYNAYTKQYACYHDKEGKIHVPNVKLRQLDHCTSFQLRHKRCIINGQNWRVVSGDSFSDDPCNNGFVLVIRPEHKDDTKCDWYIKKYKQTVGKRRRHKFYKRAQELHYKIGRPYMFFLRDRKGQYLHN